MVVKDDNRIPMVNLGGWPFGVDVVILADEGDFFMAGGIGEAATSASVRIGLGASAGGIACGFMSCSNWPGWAGDMYGGVWSFGNPKHGLPVIASI